MESEAVKNLDKQNDIDIQYYDILCDEAIRTLEEFVPFDKLVEKRKGKK